MTSVTALLCLLRFSSPIDASLSLRTFIVGGLAVAVVIGFAILRLDRQRVSGETAASVTSQKQPSLRETERLEIVRPKMFLDSVFSPTEAGGVYFRSRSGSFTLNEAETYELVTEPAPRFLGR